MVQNDELRDAPACVYRNGLVCVFEQSGGDWGVQCKRDLCVQQEGTFSYDGWVEGMRQGRTFITNGPALFLEVEGQPPGAVIEFSEDRKVGVKVRWLSHYPVNRVGLVHDGEVVEVKGFPAGSYDGSWETEISVKADGWIAARCSGTARDSFNQSIYAHTSPVYLENGRPNRFQKESATFFLASIDQSLEWIGKTAKFTKDEQRDAVRELFLKGRKEYEGMVTG